MPTAVEYALTDAGQKVFQDSLKPAYDTYHEVLEETGDAGKALEIAKDVLREASSDVVIFVSLTDKSEGDIEQFLNSDHFANFMEQPHDGEAEHLQPDIWEFGAEETQTDWTNSDETPILTDTVLRDEAPDFESDIAAEPEMGVIDKSDSIFGKGTSFPVADENIKDGTLSDDMTHQAEPTDQYYGVDEDGVSAEPEMGIIDVGDLPDGVVAIPAFVAAEPEMGVVDKSDSIFGKGTSFPIADENIKDSTLSDDMTHQAEPTDQYYGVDEDGVSAEPEMGIIDVGDLPDGVVAIPAFVAAEPEMGIIDVGDLPDGVAETVNSLEDIKLSLQNTGDDLDQAEYAMDQHNQELAQNVSDTYNEEESAPHLEADAQHVPDDAPEAPDTNVVVGGEG